MMMDYAASTAAMEVFTTSVASRVAQRGIRADGASPGPVRTVLNLVGRRFPDDHSTGLGSPAPRVRVAQPEEAASARAGRSSFEETGDGGGTCAAAS